MDEKKKENASPESGMNVWAKLLAVRAGFIEAGAKKTGKNPHAEFMYFELADIVPIAESLFKKYGLLMIPNFLADRAVAEIVNTEKPDEKIEFSIPLVFIAEPGKFRMNEVQGIGAAVTYYRRYLYMIILDLVEADAIDGQDGEKNQPKEEETAKPAAAPKKPATPEERKAIKEKLVSEETNADEATIAEVRKLLKKLMDTDPEQEEFVQDVAVKTKGFTEITKNQCTSLIALVKKMLAEYNESTEELE